MLRTALLHTGHRTIVSSTRNRGHCCSLNTAGAWIGGIQGARRMSTAHSLFLGSKTQQQPPLYLIVLNYNLPHGMLHVWPKADFKVCADGGANRLHDLLPRLLPQYDTMTTREAFLPDAIRGDLDSMRPDVKEFYERHGVPITDLSHDQDTTDLTKAVMFLEEKVLTANPAAAQDHTILVLGAIGGRLDHTLANLNSLYCFQHLHLVLYGEGNLVRLLRPGRTVIRPDRRFEGPSCGLVPLAGPITASSSGLRWNLADTKLQFCGLISTSNELVADEVVVDSDGPVLWMTELRAEPDMPEVLPGRNGRQHQ